MRLTSIAHVLRATALVALAASVYACSSDSGTGPRDTELASLNDVLVESTQPDIEWLGATLIPAAPLQVVTSSPPASPAGCSYDAASRSFVCARITSGGLTIDRTFILFDAAGNRQSEFVRGSTAAVQTKTHIVGTLTSAAGTHSFDHSDDRTVSGLLTTRHVLSGTSSMTMDGTFSVPAGSAPSAMHSTSASTIESLVLPSKENRWPGPGVITTSSTSTWGTLPPMSFTTRAVFNGTRCVTMTITSPDGPSQTMTIDMSNPRANGCTA
jgi:hypothetical protein